MNLKSLLSILVIAVAAFVPACEKKAGEPAAKGATKESSAVADASGRCPHEIKQEKCPFCNPKLIESDGFCGEHGFAEALCVQCRPYLKAAFRAKGDWCKEHSMPETQCVQCNPKLKDNIKPGQHGATTPAAGTAAAGDKSAAAANCEHGIAKAKCPFCTPSLIQSDGFCKEHDIAEALCVKCRSYLETAFKAKGDWCKEHSTPESQCAECNPKLKDKPKSNG